MRGEVERIVGADDWCVPSSVQEELRTLAQGDGATARAASGALRLLDGLPIEPTDLPGDDGVLEVARRTGAVVVSNDKRLGQEALRSGLRVLHVRGPGLEERHR